MERTYKVTFDTQKDRRYITWGLLVTATNKKNAMAAARERWHSEDNPHQRTRKRDRYYGTVYTEHPHTFHMYAERTNEDSTAAPDFFVISNRYANWG